MRLLPVCHGATVSFFFLKVQPACEILTLVVVPVTFTGCTLWSGVELRGGACELQRHYHRD